MWAQTVWKLILNVQARFVFDSITIEQLESCLTTYKFTSHLDNFWVVEVFFFELYRTQNSKIKVQASSLVEPSNYPFKLSPLVRWGTNFRPSIYLSFKTMTTSWAQVYKIHNIYIYIRRKLMGQNIYIFFSFKRCVLPRIFRWRDRYLSRLDGYSYIRTESDPNLNIIFILFINQHKFNQII